jgi:hypothetical protein
VEHSSEGSAERASEGSQRFALAVSKEHANLGKQNYLVRKLKKRLALLADGARLLAELSNPLDLQPSNLS